MRTTLDIDDDLLAVAKEAGFEPFPAPPGVVTTNDQVDTLRETEGI